MKKYLFFLFCFLFFVSSAAAKPADNQVKKITILYTGSTHAALYHCDCPIEPDGGLSRRMTLVKQLRMENSNTLLVDAGGFFAGGPGDVHLQGEALDKKRNEINLKGISLIGYDALNIGSDEFSFGKDYFLGAIKGASLPLVSNNLKLEGVGDSIIKKLNGLNVAVIGLSDNGEDKAEALRKAVLGAKKNKADIIILLSYQSEDENKKLLESQEGVDIVISGKTITSSAPYIKIKDCIFLHGTWQGRHLGKIDLEVTGRKITNFTVANLRLSKEIANDPTIEAILPPQPKPNPIVLTVVNPKDVITINQQEFIKFLKSVFPGLTPKFVEYESKEGKGLVDLVKAKLLPVYFLAKDAQKESGFKRIEKFLESKGEYLYINPRFSGASSFIGRKKINKQLDIFVSTRDKDLKNLLTVLKELQAKHKDYAVNLHFLAMESAPGTFSAPSGLAEMEEDLRQVCVMRYSADKFWDYAICRAQNAESSWWESCADKLSIKTEVIKKCSMSGEGRDRLRENIKLGKELEIASGPTFVVNNNSVFAAVRAPQLSELEEIIEK